MSIDLPQSAAPRVSVIIPSSTRLDLLHACLRSLARFGPAAIPYETIVVLNQATPEAEAQLRETATGIQVVSSPVNLGLAGAGNRGRALARGELLILLHDDAEIEPGWMESLVETADAHPEAGAIGGKVLCPDGRLQWAGGILWRTGITSRPWVGEAPAPTAFDRLRAVDFCGTSSLLVRAALWDFVGGLDEQFYPVILRRRRPRHGDTETRLCRVVPAELAHSSSPGCKHWSRLQRISLSPQSTSLPKKVGRGAKEPRAMGEFAGRR